MMSRKLIATVASALTGLMLMTAAASAAPAQATTSVNVRSGPSTSYRVVDVLGPGERVDVESCRSNGWCFVSKRGADGWVSSRYLSKSSNYRNRHDSRSRHDRYSRADRYNDDFNMRFGGSGFSFSFGTDDRRNHHRRDRDCYRRHGQIVCR